LLIENPRAIRDLHIDYLVAGADCISSASYQATVAGFRRCGLGDKEAADLLRLSATLAIEARDSFWKERGDKTGRLRPVIAASIGPYGAFLADGSEYTGDYPAEVDLVAFHEERWRILADTEADLFACETIPSRQEATVLLDLLRSTPGTWAWMSFSCRNGTELNDGNRVVDVARDCDAEARVAAVGVNCTSPAHISRLITEVRKGTDKPVIVYPNSGERYDTVRKAWDGEAFRIDGENGPVAWLRLGASGIGGCCRVGPKQIAALRQQIVPVRD
jgi:homocysteine S-methyltransferase